MHVCTVSATIFYRKERYFLETYLSSSINKTTSFHISFHFDFALSLQYIHHLLLSEKEVDCFHMFVDVRRGGALEMEKAMEA